MAIMMPARLVEATQSDAEKKLFKKIKDELGDEWTVLHSLGLSIHHRKPWAEIDFVAVGPEGIFCIEVKGGRVARREGDWHFTDRNEQTTVKKEGPFAQVGSASAALRAFITGSLERSSNWVFGYAVAFPDIIFNVPGPDIVSEVIYDARDHTASFATFVNRLATFWWGRLGGSSTRLLAELTRVEADSVVQRLRKDFDLRPTMRLQLRTVGDEMIRLTGEQYRVLDGIADNARALVRGGAGTGKTMLAVEETRRRSEAGESVLYCCFNRHLARRLRDVFSGTTVTVRHLHGLMAELVGAAGLSSKLPNAQDADLFSLFYPELALEAVLEHGVIGPFDLLIIDEGQDLLREPYLDLLEVLLDGGLSDGAWRVFLDSNQDIFSGTEPASLERLLGANPAQFRLLVNCRNTSSIATSTSLLSGIRLREICNIEGPDVEQLWWTDRNDQRRQLSRFLNRLFSDGVLAKDVVVLSVKTYENSCVSPALNHVAFPIIDLRVREVPDGSIGFCTVQGFKGLESDVVLLVDVDDLRSLYASANLYVGASRARGLLGVFLSQGVKDDYRQRAFDYGTELAGRTAL